MKTSVTVNAVSVIVVEDHPMTLDGIRGYLETDPSIEVIGTTSDGVEAVALVEENVPDVAIVDLRLDRSEIDGVEVIRRVTQTSPSTQVLVLSAYDDDEYVFPALKAGAMGYLLKTASPDRILDAVHSVAKRQPFLDRRIYEKLCDFLTQIRDEVVLPEPIPDLTPREGEVLQHLAAGLSNQEIADALVISIKTVKTHVSNILQKLHLSDRTQVRYWALQRGAGQSSCQPE